MTQVLDDFFKVRLQTMSLGNHLYDNMDEFQLKYVPFIIQLA